jgi:NAD(P)-dependent dehydrogenase (short-subunit alcohol dehydrogenase family)
MPSLTFLVTGVNAGLGRAVALASVRAGHTVVGTIRREEDRSGFETIGPGRAFLRQLDLTDEPAVAGLVAETERDIAGIDVLVTNAGYGHEGLIEESSLTDLRRQFELNVFGPVTLIRAVLPAMRNRRRGHIIAITSMGGEVTSPGLGYYHGAKYALEGIMDTLGQEVAGLGIHVTSVEPGSFRVDWSGPAMVRAPRSIADYDPLFADGPQLRTIGDPERAGQVILELAGSADPPAHVMLERVL